MTPDLVELGSLFEISAAMYSVLVQVVGAVLVIGQYLVDAPRIPPLDFMLRMFGYRLVPGGIEQVWPLLLTYGEEPVLEGGVSAVLSWISEWLAVGHNPFLGGLILALTFSAVMHYQRRTP